MRNKNAARRTVIADDPMMDINTTPLIDVMLVLLVMLIITIPVQLNAVKVNMPVGNPPPTLEKPDVLRLDIDAQSTVLWNGEAVATRSDLEQRMARAAAQPIQPEVHLRPDSKASYDVVAGVLTSAQQAGLTKIGIVGSEQYAQ